MVAKIGVDTAENGPSKVSGVVQPPEEHLALLEDLLAQLQKRVDPLLLRLQVLADEVPAEVVLPPQT